MKPNKIKEVLDGKGIAQTWLIEVDLKDLITDENERV